MTADSGIFDVAIIGGGFSGLMALHHLVRTGGSGDRFAVIEPEENLGYGLAYRTTNPRHLLNVPAAKMSALPDHPDHFIKWLLSGKGLEASRAVGVDRVWQAGDYVPRCLYARYLGDIVQETLQAARAKGIEVQHLRQKAADVERSSSYRVELDNGHFLQSKALILATGNLSARSAEQAPDFISDPWRYNYASLRGESGTVGILGTGLTMVDTALSLRQAGFAGKILAFSRRGLLPEVHNDVPAAHKAPLALPAHAPGTLAALMQSFRDEARVCLSNQISWQRVFDRWRPHAVMVWRKLGTNARKAFFEKIFTLWNIHRHRMAPEIRFFIDEERAAGNLKIFKGGAKVVSNPDGLGLASGEAHHAVRKIFDCRGSCHDISRSSNTFISTLHRKDLIQQHETGWGIKVCNDLQALPLGRDGSFLAIGPLLIGECLETTAVPELRQQAQKAASSLSDFLHPAPAAKHG